jgi:hypothetical protein
MLWSDIPWSPSTRVLRQFAGLCPAVGAGLGAWQYQVAARPTIGLALASAGIVVGVLCLARPSLCRWLLVTWMIAAFPLGWAVSKIVLAVTFFGLFLPLGLLLRLTGRDPLALKARRHQQSYWTPKPQPADPRRYFQQF